MGEGYFSSIFNVFVFYIKTIVIIQKQIQKKPQKNKKQKAKSKLN